MGKNDLNATVVEKRIIHPTLMTLKVKFDDLAIPDFKAGQFGTLGLPELKPTGDKVRLVRRAYSVASSNKESAYLEYFITKVEGGALTPRLFDLESGDKLWMATKVTGLFTLDPVPPENNLVFVGTGTGLSPFLSMLKSNPELGTGNQKVTLVHCARHIEDLAYDEELKSMTKERDSFSYIRTVTRSQDDSWDGLNGRIPQLWKEGHISKKSCFDPKPENTHVLLCGNPDMIKEMIALLETDSYKVHTRKEPGNIHFEKYW